MLASLPRPEHTKMLDLCIFHSLCLKNSCPKYHMAHIPVTILFTCFVPCTFLVFFKLVHFSQFSWLLVELAFLFLLLSTQAILCITAKLLQNSWSTSLLTFLVIQWLGIFLPMQGTRVQFLVWEDPICQGATKSTHHNYWSPCALEPTLGHKRSHCSEKPVHGN